MKNKLKQFIVFTLLISLFLIPAHSETVTAEPYDTEAFPQSLKDLRRFEIITLGSMPFVTLDVTLGYSAIKSIRDDTNFTPFDTSSYTQEEVVGVMVTSLCISAGIGLADFIVNLVKRANAEKKAEKVVGSYINIVPITEDEDAIKIDLPSSENFDEETDVIEVSPENKTENSDSQNQEQGGEN
jgi:hypothetical protein